LQAARLEGVKIIYIFDNMLPTPAIKVFSTVTVLILCGLLRAQTPAPEQDCVGAILVNTSSYPFGTYNGIGTGDNEIDSPPSCLEAGENNSLWLRVCISANGTLSFDICPDMSSADFDWVVYNSTNASCPYINSADSLIVSCNFSGSTFPVHCTGANGGPNPQDEPVIPVLEGETYYILINGSGFCGGTINFGFSPIGGTFCVTTVDGKSVGMQKPVAFPNPATNSLTLSIPGLKQGQTAGITIYNTTGVLVKQQPGLNQPENQLDITSLPTGLYYYIVQTPYGQNSGRFVKE
jgi:hypothetical protein